MIEQYGLLVDAQGLLGHVQRLAKALPYVLGRRHIWWGGKSAVDDTFNFRNPRFIPPKMIEQAPSSVIVSVLIGRRAKVGRQPFGQRATRQNN
jgi:hypothetical protein